MVHHRMRGEQRIRETGQHWVSVFRSLPPESSLLWGGKGITTQLLSCLPSPNPCRPRQEKLTRSANSVLFHEVSRGVTESDPTQLISADGKVPGLPAGGQASASGQQGPRAQVLGNSVPQPPIVFSTHEEEFVC